MQDESSKNIGPELDDTPMCGRFRLTVTGGRISSAADSPALTYPALVEGLEFPAMMAAAYGSKCTESFAIYDRDSSSWKTSQSCLFAGLGEFSGTWPRAGLIVHGNAFLLPPWVPGISGTEFSSWVWIGTPSAAMKVRSPAFQRGTLKNPAEIAKELGGKPNPEWIESLMGFPIGWTDCEDLEMPSCLK